MTLSIIIINYNVKDFLEQCLHSVAAAIGGLEAEVIVVDNRSVDGSIPYLQSRFGWVHFICNKENTGFSKANNQALLLATGRYVLFLNPDTIIPEESLKAVIGFFGKNKNAGAVGVQMINGCGLFLPESKRSFPSLGAAFFKLSGLSVLFPSSKVFNQYALGHLDKEMVNEVDVLSGAFMMIPRAVLDKTGGFDEDFFMYGEDIDLSYRIKKQGYKNFYMGTVSMIHFKGESSKKNVEYVRVFYKAMILFVKKYYKGYRGRLIFLQVAIHLRALMSMLSIPFAELYKRLGFKKIRKYRRVLLIGDAANTFAAEKHFRIRRQNIPIITKQPACVHECGLSTKDEIIFCTGSFSYQQSIDLLKRIKLPVKWFRSVN